MKRAWVVCGVLALMACVEHGRETPRKEPTDVPFLSFSETAAIGGFEAEGVEALGRVSAAALVPGTDYIAVADAHTQEVHYFTGTGEHVQTVGRRGGGPGEFRAVRALQGQSDGSLCVWDVALARVTRIGPTGGVINTASVDLGAMESIRPGFVGFLPGCWIVLRDRRERLGMKNVPEGIRRDTISFVLFNAAGTQIERLATQLGAPRWFVNRNGLWDDVDLVFGHALIAFTLDQELWYGLADSLRWQRINTKTGAHDALRIPAHPRVTTAEGIEAERTRRLAELRVPEEGAVFVDGVDLATRAGEQSRAAVEAVPAADLIPSYDQAVPGSDGSVWLRRYPDPSSEQVTWVDVWPSGALVGQFTLSRAAHLLAASHDRLVILETDAFDTPIVRVLERTNDR